MTDSHIFDALDQVVGHMYGGVVARLIKEPHQRKVTIDWIVANFKVTDVQASDILDDYLSMTPDVLSDDLLNSMGVYDK